MTPAEFKLGRLSLALSAKQMAEVMGYGDKSRIYRIENSGSVPEQAARLMAAYLDGYRPDDWPG